MGKEARCCHFIVVVVVHRYNRIHFDASEYFTIRLITALLPCKYYDYCSYYFQAEQNEPELEASPYRLIVNNPI